MTLIRGRARIAGELRVARGQESLLARKAVVVATGSTALIPDIPGLRAAKPWTNREATTAATVPPRLAILGGGVVGVEMAQAWGALGSAVTLIHRGSRLIQREEPFASEQVLGSLRELGVDVRLANGREASRARVRSVWSSTTARPSRPSRCWWRSGARPAPRASVWSSSGSRPTGRSRSATTCACRAATGCTRWVTSTAARCSRTWASTRAGSPPTPSSAAGSSCARTAGARRA